MHQKVSYENITEKKCSAKRGSKFKNVLKQLQRTCFLKQQRMRMQQTTIDDFSWLLVQKIRVKCRNKIDTEIDTDKIDSEK